MKKYLNQKPDPFLTAERELVRLSSVPSTSFQYVQNISRLFQGVSGCDVLEFRICRYDKIFHWRFKAADERLTVVDREPSYYQGLVIPVFTEDTPLEAVILEMLHRGYDPVNKFEGRLAPFYVKDTTHKLTLGETEDSPRADLSGTGSAALLIMPFKVEGKQLNVAILYSQTRDFIAEADIPGYEILINTLAIAMKFRWDLLEHIERTKELTSVYDITQYINESDNDEILLQKAVNRIPQALQFSDRACSTLTFQGKTYNSPHAAHTDRLISSVYKTEAGHDLTVSIYYREPDTSEVPLDFMEEEQRMLDAVTQKLGNYFDREYQRLELKALSAQLRQADRLATLGTISSGIAHELNDPLTNILGYTQMLQKSIQEPKAVADLDRIVRSSLHARDIVRKFLIFGSQSTSKPSQYTLNQIITDTVDLLQNRLDKNGVEVCLKLEEHLPSLKGNLSQMVQVVTNLCVNSMQAMPRGGKLTISTHADKRGIKLSVADTGEGIEPQVLEKIFLPFYTTKPVGEGTGLGLSVVHDIVEALGGRIEVKSKPNKGCRFEISLPV